MKHFTSPATLFATMLAICLSQEAKACVVAPQPFNPALEVFDAVFRAKVSAFDGDTSHPNFSLDPTSTIVGRLVQQSLRVRFDDYVYGTCGPLSAPLQNGDEVVVYAKYVTGKLRPREWIKTKSSTNPQRAGKGWYEGPWWIAREISDEQVEKDNKDALLRQKRRLLFFTLSKYYGDYPGALSFNDPRLWFRKGEYPADFLNRASGSVIAKVDLAGDGSVANCSVLKLSNIAEFYAKICAIIRSRARFVPPVFSEERIGIINLPFALE